MKASRLIKAFLRQPVDCTPVWLMRQAGRYLPEYRAIRQKVPDFIERCKTPSLVCEITLQPLARFNLDGAIIFSDILMLPDAMGLGLHFIQDEGPRFLHPLRHAEDIEKLFIPDPVTDFSYLLESMTEVKKSLPPTCPLIGFAGSPWTLAAYMIEGQGKTSFYQAKKMRYERPDLLAKLIHTLSQAIVVLLQAQIKAGADAVMIFDTWGGLLTCEDYQILCVDPLKKIIQQLNINRDASKKIPVPVIIFTKYGGQWLDAMLSTGCDVISLDWTVSLFAVRQQLQNRAAVQGNLDPALLYTRPDCIEKAVQAILESWGPQPGHVFNLGHGVPPDILPENVQVLVDAVHRLSIPYHAMANKEGK